jgi:hypothetical protein
MKPIAPGVYDDEAGGLHVDIVVFFAANGIADTPANRQTLLEEWRRIFDGPVVEVDEPIR